jgi:glucose/arabinose dehydrogenase
MNKLRTFSVCCVVAVVVPAALPSCITTERVTFGLSSPVFVTWAPEDDDHVYIVERGGRIKVMDLNTQSVTVFLDLTSLVQSGGEQGLLGLAFSSEYDLDDKFYVNYTQKPDGATRVVEYKVSANPLVADPASARPVLTVPQPQANHNGGWMGFSVDNHLYVALGDGGGSNDDGAGHTPGTGNAQDIDQNLLGKILRINPFGDEFPADPDRNYSIPLDNPFRGVAGDDEIWCYGLRNPWRCSFDRFTFDLWIGDVGELSREEIDFQPLSSNGGENYGWRLREGSIQTPTPGIGGPPPPGNVEPLYDYSHGTGSFQGNCVIGGYVYRGPIAELQGKYFFGDNTTQRVWSLTRSGSTFTDLTDWTTAFRPDVGSIGSISSFGEDSAGNLYIVDLDGEIFRVVKINPFAKAVRDGTRAVTQIVSPPAPTPAREPVRRR